MEMIFSQILLKSSTSQEESTSGADEFNDGLDSALMDGPHDKAILDQMTEAEREQEITRHLSNHERLDERKKIYKRWRIERDLINFGNEIRRNEFKMRESS